MKKLSRDATALLVALVVCVVVMILLTPIGFETRPQSDLKTVGYVSIGTIFTGLALFILSIAFLFRRVKLASKLAIIASVTVLRSGYRRPSGSLLLGADPSGD